MSMVVWMVKCIMYEIMYEILECIMQERIWNLLGKNPFARKVSGRVLEVGN